MNDIYTDAVVYKKQNINIFGLNVNFIYLIPFGP